MLKVLQKYDFKKVVLESITVKEQVILFSSAKVVVSAHGSGLTNLLFCKPGTKVFEFFSPNYVNGLYWILSNHLEIDYFYLIGEGERPPEYFDPHLVWEDINLNLNKLDCLLRTILD